MSKLIKKLSGNQTFISILGFMIIFCAIGGYAIASGFDGVDEDKPKTEKVINIEGDFTGNVTINLTQPSANPSDESFGGLHDNFNKIFQKGLRAGPDRKQVINSDGDLNVEGTVIKSQVITCTDATTTPFAIQHPFSSGSAVVVGLIYNQSGVATSTLSIDIGVASDAYTSADNLIDGLEVATSTTAYEGNNYGTNGLGVKSIDSTEYITGTITTLYSGAITEATNTYACTVEVLFIQ